MRVLMLLSSIAMGGAERNVVSVLPYLRDAGVDVVLCTLNKRRDSALVDVFSKAGIERFDLGANRLSDRRSWGKFLSFIHAQRVDIVHAQDQDAIIYAGMSKRFANIKTLMTRHVLQEPSRNWKFAIRSRLVLWLARRGMDRVVAVSEAVRHRFAVQARMSPSKIETIYNGIDLEKFTLCEPRAEIRKKLGWDPDRKIAIHVAVFRPEKGYDLLFEALPQIQAALPTFQIKLVGDDRLESALHDKASILGDAVEFMGQRMDVPELLAASDLLIQTSWSEALPTVLIEAGASSRPVVATNVGGTSEIVVDGRGGFVVEPGDASDLADRVVQILCSPGLAEQMGRQAYTRVIKMFTLESQAGRTKMLYEKMLGAVVT